MYSLPGMFRANVSILLFSSGLPGAYRRPLLWALYRLLFNHTWSNAGLAHTAIFLYSSRAMSLLVFDTVFICLLAFVFWFRLVSFWFSRCAVVTGNIVYYWCRLPCTCIGLRWQTFIPCCLAGTGTREVRLSLDGKWVGKGKIRVGFLDRQALSMETGWEW